MQIDDWVRKSISKGRLLVEFPASWNEAQKVEARRRVLEKLTGKDIGNIPVDEKVLEAASGGNIENAIGLVSVPLGVAGPLLVKGDWAEGEYFIPLATTEGALVASINRGCKAIWESGGVKVFIEDVGITRGPVFKVRSLAKAREFISWLSKNKRKLVGIAEKTSEYLKLVDFKTSMVGKSVFVRFRFNTYEAMGMNMATIATQAIVDFIESKLDVSCVSITGNFCVDKKPSQLNFILGRGKRVWSEVFLSAAVIRGILKTSVDELVDVFYRKTLVGSVISGSLGFNAHFANVIAALYLATGQDIAHVVHGSTGIVTAEKERKGARISVFLPSLILGTVGGGTHLPHQQTALQILGLGKGKKGEAKALAEIVGGVTLAGEISLGSSLAEGSLARAHQRLGRKQERR